MTKKESACQYYIRNREKIKAKARKIYKLNPEKRKSKNDFRFRYPDRHKELNRNARFKVKMEMIQAYGGACKCCGETRLEFLSIDHINGNGGKHRKSLGKPSGNYILYWLRKHNYPKKNFQLLCMNCNWAKGKYGYCPHKKMHRPSIDNYLLGVATAVSKRSTCIDMQVGCVLATKAGYILSTGYNGAPSGEPHCKIKNGKCSENGPNHRVVHAEQNCITFAAKNGTAIDNSIAYVTHEPCLKCSMLLRQAGVIKVIVKK